MLSLELMEIQFKSVYDKRDKNNYSNLDYYKSLIVIISRRSSLRGM